jgi:hypothetical protein
MSVFYLSIRSFVIKTYIIKHMQEVTENMFNMSIIFTFFVVLFICLQKYTNAASNSDSSLFQWVSENPPFCLFRLSGYR